MPEKGTVIQFDLVAENIGSGTPVDLGIVGDLGEILSVIKDRISVSVELDWLRQVRVARDSWLKNLENSLQDKSVPFNPPVVVDSISRHSAPEEIIALDSGDNVIWFGKHFSSSCQNVLVSGSWRTMGFALPAALTAKIKNPGVPVTCITGDGGLNMVPGELLTALRYRLPLRIIVFNNETLAMEKNEMDRRQLNPEEVEVTTPDYVKLANACGMNATRIASYEELENVLKQSSSRDSSLLIDIPVRDNPPPEKR
ncbi:MAG: thiamine pyrophosphate-dependent enzyme [Halanaerobiales bacterium]